MTTGSDLEADAMDWWEGSAGGEWGDCEGYLKRLSRAREFTMELASDGYKRKISGGVIK